MGSPKGETRLVQTFEVKVFIKDPEDVIDMLDVEESLTSSQTHLWVTDEVQVSDVTALAMYKAHGIT